MTTALVATVSCTLSVNGDGWVFGPESMGTVAVADSVATSYDAQLASGTNLLLAPRQSKASYFFFDPSPPNVGTTFFLLGPTYSGVTPTADGLAVSNVNPSLIPINNQTLFNSEGGLAPTSQTVSLKVYASQVGGMNIGWF